MKEFGLVWLRTFEFICGFVSTYEDWDKQTFARLLKTTYAANWALCCSAVEQAYVATDVTNFTDM